MATKRQPHLFLTLVFLAIVFAPGLVQLGIEAGAS